MAFQFEIIINIGLHFSWEAQILFFYLAAPFLFRDLKKKSLRLFFSNLQTEMERPNKKTKFVLPKKNGVEKSFFFIK